MNEMAVTFLHADRQHKANSRFLVTALSVDISQNTPSFSYIMTLARVWSRLFLFDILRWKTVLASAGKPSKSVSPFLV